MNWWLMLLSGVLGFALSWLWMVRRVTREVPRERTVSRETGAGVATPARDAETSAVFDQEAPAPSWGREAATIGATAAADKSRDVPQAAPIDPDVMHPVELEGESDDLPEVTMVAPDPVETQTVEVEPVESELVEPESVEPESVEPVTSATIGALAARDKTVDEPATMESAEEVWDDGPVITDAEPAALPATDASVVSDPSEEWVVESTGESAEESLDDIPIIGDSRAQSDPTAYDAEDSDYVLTEAATDEVTVDDAELEPESEGIGTAGDLAGGAVAAGPSAWSGEGDTLPLGAPEEFETVASETEAPVAADLRSAVSAGTAYDAEDSDYVLTGAATDEVTVDDAEPEQFETEASVAQQFEAGGVSPVATDGEYAEAPVATEAPYGLGSAAAQADGSGPEGWPVKGNADSMLFHTQDSPGYGRARAKVWFQDEASATSAGFQHWDRKRRGGLTGSLESASHGARTAGPTAAEVTGGTARGFADTGTAGVATEGVATESLDTQDLGVSGQDADESAEIERLATEAAAPVAPDEPYGPGSASTAEDGSGPVGWEVKGNANSMLFHTQESPSYGKTRPEVWFQDEASAKAAGFAHWDRKRR